MSLEVLRWASNILLLRPYWRKDCRLMAVSLDPPSKTLGLGYCNIIDATAGSRLDLWLQSTADEIPILGCVIQELWLSIAQEPSKALKGCHWPEAIDLEVTSPLHTKRRNGLSIPVACAHFERSN